MYIPAVSPLFRLEVVPDQGTFLVSTSTTHLITTSIHQRIMQLVNGTRTVDDIARLLSDEYGLPEVYYALTHLERKGYLIEQPQLMPRSEVAFWMDNGVLPSRLTQTPLPTINVESVPELDARIAESMKKHFSESGYSVDVNGSIEVVLTDHYLNNSLAGFNADSVEKVKPWLLVKPVGKEIWIGPLFIPPETGCWQCLAYHLDGQRAVAQYIRAVQHYEQAVYVQEGSTASSSQLALHLAVMEVDRWVRTGIGPVGEILVLDTLTLEKQRHVLNRRPNCPVCGLPTPMKFPAPIELQSHIKHFTNDNGHREYSPEQFLKQFERFASPITGLCHFKPSKAFPELNFVSTTHNLSRPKRSLSELRIGLRSNSGGKGTSAIQGSVSALAETIERYSGLWQGSEYFRVATYKEMGEEAIHPQSYLLFSEQQYSTYTTQDRTTDRYDRIPRPFDDNVPVAWSPAWSLTNQTFKHILTASCYYAPEIQGSDYAHADSNGCAAGASVEEAILQGFLELVERDCIAMWWYNRLQRPLVDIATFDHPFIRAMEQFYQRHTRQLYALDLTNDFGIPTFAAVSPRAEGPGREILLGIGCHFDPVIALTRAIGEVNQVFAVYYQTSPEYWKRNGESRLVQWMEHATLENQPYLAPLSDVPTVTPETYQWDMYEDLRDDVNRCQALIEERGMEMLVLDQTRPEIGLPVVRVIVPGLRHFWRHLGPGRLYDVPVQLGWLPAPLREEALNPITMFL